MNYRHLYHAGNFAEVFKHILLVSLLRSLTRKDKPLCYLETHSGIGHYDLQSPAARKTQEANAGIGRLWSLYKTPQIVATIPEVIRDYLDLVKNWNESHSSAKLRFYPGSPVLTKYCLRAEDKMVLTELHAEDVIALKQQFAGDKQVAVHHLDGYLGLKAFLPPQQGRGLVFIDPPFERADEFTVILAQLQLALQRFKGIYAIWYPIKSLPAVRRFYKALQAAGIRDMLCCELGVPGATSLTACGMIVINPPWHWYKTADLVLSWLSQNLTKPAGSYRVQWLARE